MKREILLLGNERLYQVSEDVKAEELSFIKEVVCDLHDTMMEFRRIHEVGRAIAAPQIGVKKRLIYMYIEKPIVFINPRLEYNDNEMMEVMDDCMSFPNLLVKVKRFKRCRIKYRNLDFKECSMNVEGDLSELLQHEYDHLDGILATMRAVDDKSFYLKARSII